ncbi:MAG: glycosyltransferase [bacterium]|nr:glycosyltransferase [bacterium]
MKKILLYTDTPQIGGAELQIFLLAKFLNKDKFTPILACSNFEALDKWCNKFENEDIKVIRIKVAHKHDPRHLFKLKEIIKEEEIDLLHAQIWNPASCRYAYGIKSIPVITTEHDPFKLSFIKNALKKKSLKNVKKIITISNHNKKLLKKLYPNHSSKIEMIHNGLDTLWWQSQLLRFTENDRKHIKEEIFHAKENTLIVTCIAELHERKGQKYLIEAIPEVTEEFPNVKFVFIGKGPNEENLKKLVKKLKLEKHVTFTGQQKEIPKLLKSSDIFCLPSRREAFGLVNLEAMLTPLPVIATKVGGIPEIINENTGILVQPEDSKSLSQALNILIENPKIREKMALNGQKQALTFDAQNMAKKYEKIYEDVLK